VLNLSGIKRKKDWERTNKVYREPLRPVQNAGGGILGSHAFNFDGGSKLNTMGATWFVSHAFYTHIDKTHLDWRNVKTYPRRASVFNHTHGFHKFWLEKIGEMDDRRLNTNIIGLPAARTKEMVKELLATAFPAGK
jgi:hypothetical protein